MASSPLTVDQFAASIKAKYPQYASIPDAQLVEKVVAKYPQYKSSIGGAPPSAPAKPSELTAPDAFPTRVLDRISQNMQGMSDFPGSALRDARQRYLARHPQGSSVDPVTGAYDAARSSIEAVVNPMAESAASLTPPGIAERLSKKEDPAKLAGDALMMLTPGTEELGRATHTVGDATKAGSVFGAKTRAIQMMDHLDQVAKDVPVDYAPAYQWAKKAMALEAYGYQVPAPIKAYVAMVESRLKGGAEGMGGGAFMDRAGSTHPLTYQDARNFEASLGAKIDWDDPGGKMNALQKKMRESLGDSTSSALQPYGLDTLYKRAKSEFTKAYGAKEKWGPFGYFGGKVAGYGAGTFTGHPLILGYAGAKGGQSLAESLADRVVNAGKDRPRAAPRASAGPSPAEIEANTRRMMEVWKRGKEQAAARGTAPRSVESDALRAIEDRAWQESVFGHSTSPEPDIGAKVRAKNPEPTRAEVKAARNPNDVTVNVKGDDRTSTLTPDQMKRWNDAADRYKKSVEQVRRSYPNPQEAAPHIKRLGMQYAAEKRAITGELTGIEKRNISRREASNYVGKKINVLGQQGTIKGHAFGRVRVELADGRTVSVNPEDIQ